MNPISRILMSQSRFKLVFHFILLLIFVPFCILQWILYSMFNRTVKIGGKRVAVEQRKTLLITGASIQALQMARIMGQAGHRVILVARGFDVMTVLAGFSKYVEKFYMISPSKVYEDQLIKIWSEEKCDWFLPMNLSVDDIKFNIVMDFQALQEDDFRFSTISVNSIFLAETLQSQPAFLQKCKDLGLLTTMDLNCVSLERQSNPKKYAANVICKKGKLLMIQTWSFEKVMRANISCNQPIEKWIECFVEATELSGMFCFDFIMDGADQPACCGCKLKLNPVISSFASDCQAEKLEKVLRLTLNNDKTINDQQVLQASPKKVFWFLEELVTFKTLDELLDLLQNGQEIIWRADDLLPFVMFYTLSPFMIFNLATELFLSFLRNLFQGSKSH